MSAGVEFGPARGADRAAALELFDAVFLRERGRDGSIAQRYAPLFTHPAASQLLVARSAAAVRAALIMRPFTLRAADAGHRGSMIGFVATHPAHRGAGLASGLLAHALEQAACDESSFCVLWAAARAFYRKRGWQPADDGILGEAPALPDAPQDAPDAAWQGEAAQVERLASDTLGMRVPRTADWYGVVPVSAGRVALRLAGPRDAPRAYAIVGETPTARILYEIGGDECAVLSLFRGLRSTGYGLRVNARAGDAAQRALGTASGIRWQAQRLAMWFPIAPALRDIAARGWHVPWYDRI